MKIAQATVNMVSSHQYYEENTVTVQSGVMTKQSFLENLQNQEKKMDTLELSRSNGDGEAISSQNYSSLKPSSMEYLTPAEKSLESQLAEIRASILERILNLFQLFGGDKQNTGYQRTINQLSGMITSNSMVSVTTVTQTHIEQEATTFSGEGIAVTEDGRQIDFGVQFSMSRTFCEYAGMSVARAVNLVDPLVINVGSDVASISDQKFYFDLDSDGVKEEISSLGQGSGFLALDKNGDGKIGDGSELFGTGSGNGFKDLAFYDKDGNGWIDENDEVFEKLRVWLRDEDGNDRLLSLQEADVGAIYLESAKTQFTQQNSNFQVAAMLRSSGIFLRESGTVGTIQQMDMATM